MDKPSVGFSWNLVWNRARPRNAGALSRRHFLNIFGLENGRTLLRARAQISDNFWRNYFAYGKLEFTSTILPIIPVMSYRSIEVGAPGTIGPLVIPTLVRKFFTKMCLSDATFVKIGAMSHTLLTVTNVFLPLRSINLDRSRWNSVSAIFKCYYQMWLLWKSLQWKLTLLEGVNGIFLVFYTFIARFRRNSVYEMSTKIEWLRVLWKSALYKPYFT